MPRLLASSSFLILCLSAGLGCLPATWIALHRLLDVAVPSAIYSLYATPPPLLSDLQDVRRWWRVVGPPLKDMAVVGPVSALASNVWLLATLSLVQQLLYAMWRVQREGGGGGAVVDDAGRSSQNPLRRLFAWVGGDAWEADSLADGQRDRSGGDEEHASSCEASQREQSEQASDTEVHERAALLAR